MGVVYLASDPLLNRQVAVKTVDLRVDDPQESEFLRDRLLRDARAAAVLKHPNIVSVYDVFEDSGRAYVVMEYVEGESLAARLKTNPLPHAAMILQVLRQMADALDYTHARGVVHRDIKPGNVMIDGAGTAKIMDFGIARISDTRTSTPTGMVLGTAEYMAPEQIRGEPADGRADQFALAVVAYQMMTGSTLFGPQTLATLTYKLVHEAAPPPRSRNAALPLGVDAVLAQALAKTPDQRYPTCSLFAGALAQAFSEAPTAPVAPVTMATRPAQPARPEPGTTVALAAPTRRSRTAVLIAVAAPLLVLGGALATWKLWNRTPPAAPIAAVTPAAVAPAATGEPVLPPTVERPKSQPQPSPHEATPAGSGAAPAEATHPPAVPKPAAPPEPKEEAVAPSRPQARGAEPPKAVSTPPAAIAMVPAPAAPNVAAPPEPIEESELLPVPPAPKTGPPPTPYLMAMQRGQQQSKDNDFAGALQSFTKAISLRAESAQARYSRGTAYQHLEDNQAAMRDFAEAVRLDPKLAPAYTGVGTCLVRLHRDPEALVEFQRALELKPDAVLALAGRAGVYLRRKQYRLAIADYDKALRINPRFAPAYLNRARAKEAMGDLSGAAADRQREKELRQQ
jgi:serine/threonine-protein kinase